VQLAGRQDRDRGVPVAQQAAHEILRVEPRLPGLAPGSDVLLDGAELRSRGARWARGSEREHEFGSRGERGDRLPGPRCRILVEVDEHAEARHERRGARIEPGRGQPLDDGIGRQVGRDEAHVRRDVDPRANEAFELVTPAGGMIDLEDRQLRCPCRLPAGERVESCAEQHVLSDAALHGGLEAVLGKPPADDDLRAERDHDR
jgi:hypothetical protein